jgi:ABC-2 type transport system permease protein
VASAFGLYRRLAGARLRGQLQYPASFALKTAGTFLATVAELAAIFVLFDAFPDLAGWSAGEVVFLHGIVSTALGLSEIVGPGFDQTSAFVRGGEFDRILTRPLSPFLQVLAADVQPRRLGRVAQGLLALGLGQARAGVAWTAPKALALAAAVLASALVFFTVFVIGAALCFWTVERSEVQNVFTYGGAELGSYPTHIYGRWLRAAFLFAVPVALTSYCPALYILGKPDPLGLPAALRFAAPAAALPFFGLGLLAFRFGLRHYQSTGS